MSSFPKKHQQKNKPTTQQHGVSVTQAHWQGPLPPPEILQKFGEVDPSLPAKIVAMAEKEQTHRHNKDLDDNALIRKDLEISNATHRRDFQDKQIGRLFVLSVIGIIIGFTAWMGIKTEDSAAWIFLAVELVGIAGLAVYSQKNASKRSSSQ